MVTVQIASDSRYPVDRRRIRAVVLEVLEKQRVQSDLVVSIAVVGNRKMRLLNRTYHDCDEATDVLSFPYLDAQSRKDGSFFGSYQGETQVLGDIVVSYPMVVAQAREKDKLVDEVMDFLIEHGMLHLLGIHHD